MNERVSMLDWGLSRVERTLESVAQFYSESAVIRPPGYMVRYYWDQNLITINAVAHPKFESLGKVSPKEVCKIVTNYVRAFFGMDLKKETRGPLSVAYYFEPTSFRNTNRPESLMEDIENITRINVSVSTSKTEKPPFEVLQQCDSPLMGTEIFLLEK